jgi:hypothetical protein
MNENFIGPVAALATFIGIWAGHVLVRKIEYGSVSIKLPTICFALLGILLLIGSFLTSSLTLSASLGILAMTALWDAYEFFRQEQRIIKGHAPANPNNPRHLQILKQYPSATTLDLLKRDPIGRPIDDCHPERSEGSLRSNVRDASVAQNAPSHRPDVLSGE